MAWVTNCCRVHPITSANKLGFICSNPDCGNPVTNRANKPDEASMIYIKTPEEEAKQKISNLRPEGLVIDLLKMIKRLLTPLFPEKNMQALDNLSKELCLPLIASVAKRLVNEVEPELTKQIMAINPFSTKEIDNEKFEIISGKEDDKKIETSYKNVLVLTRSKRISNNGYCISCE